MDLKPRWRVGDPEMHRCRSESVGKFGLDSTRNRNSFKYAGKKVNMPDLDQVVDWAGIGNHQPHGSESQFFKSQAFLLEVFQAVVLIDAMGLEKAIQLDASQPQHLTQLWLSYAAGPEFFKREGFQRPALQFVMNGLAAEVGGQIVGELEGELHNSTLTWLQSVIKQVARHRLTCIGTGPVVGPPGGQ